MTLVADFLVGLGLVVITMLLDYVTGYRLTFFLFYLVPILFVLKRCGQGAAFVMSFISSAAWITADIAAGDVYSDLLTPIWNTAIRLSVYLMVVSLVTTRRELESQVRQRTATLKAQMEENNRLEKELIAASEREQRRIGHDLHDSLGQHLTATAFAGKVLSKKLAAQALPEKAAAEQIVHMVEDGIELTRRLARSLHPVELEAGGFLTSLQELVANISRSFNVECTFESPPTLALNDPASNIHIYRIIQEAISNAIRHGHAKKIVVRIEVVGTKVNLSITDDGIGLSDQPGARKGMGLRIMDYRAKLIGATFVIDRLNRGGTRATCLIPLAENNSASDEK